MTAYSTQKVREAVTAHFPDGELVGLMPGGSANVTAQVRTARADLVLRIYLEEDVARFECEVETLSRLAQIDAPTPRPQQRGHACPFFGTPFIVYPMLPGETLTRVGRQLDAKSVAQRVTRLMDTAIGSASKLSVATHGYLHVTGSITAAAAGIHHQIDPYAAVIAQHSLIADELLASAVTAAREHVKTVATDRPYLVHPDLKPDNVLVHADQIAIIDWELPVGGHPALSYGGLLAEGLLHPPLRDGLRLHLDRLALDMRLAALTAGLLRCLETLSYLPTNPSIQGNRKVRPDACDLAQSISTLLSWMPR